MNISLFVIAITLFNTFGGPSNQGYCFWTITLREFDNAFTDLEIDFTPIPMTAGGVKTLEIEEIGTSHATQLQTGTIGGSCGVSGFIITRAVATNGNNKVDLIKKGLINVDIFKPRDMQIKRIIK